MPPSKTCPARDRTGGHSPSRRSTRPGLTLTLTLALLFWSSPPVHAWAASDWTVSQDTSLAPGTYVFSDLRVVGLATLTLQGDPSAGAEGRGVTIFAERLTVTKQAAITASGQGFPSGEGPGSAPLAIWGAGGASHGGRGSNGFGHIHPGGLRYGSPGSPTSLGSGGGATQDYPGGAGGGAVRLVVAGTARIDGTLSADGQDAPYDFTGGGSGGSLWLQAGRLEGAGMLSAHGGFAPLSAGGSGGGGRVALEGDVRDFLADGTLDLGGGDRNTGQSLGSLVLPPVDDLVVRGHYALTAGLHAFDTLTIAAGSHLGAWGDPDAGALGRGVELHAAAVVIDDGARISADGTGFPAGEGPGAGGPTVWSPGGGGHGGAGGDGHGSLGGETYGLSGVPLALGSGSGTTASEPHVHGAGGGALRIQARSLHVDGRLSADGILGGAGGSLSIAVDQLSGAGSVHARGGPDQRADSAGGGGGRVSIQYDTSAFTGSCDAWAGFGHKTSGAAGSVNLAPVPLLFESRATAGTGGFRPHLASAGGPPVPGNLDFRVQLAGAQGGAPAGFVLGFDAAAADLGGGNTLWVQPRVFLGQGPTSGSGPGGGSRELALPIPADPSLDGLIVRIQGYVLDPQGGGPWSLALTELLLVEIGKL